MGFEAADFEAARLNMVNGQLRPSKVTDPALLAVLRALPREDFVPAGLRARAYVDEDVPLGDGRVLLEPLLLARLLQLAAVRPGDRVLAVSGGTGYGAAVLAGLGAVVTLLEPDPALAAEARRRLAGAAGARVVEADPVAGHAAGAPYEAILIEGAVPVLPRALADQLAEGGRLVTVLAGRGGADRAVVARRIGGSVSVTEAFDCATPTLAAFAARAGFVF